MTVLTRQIDTDDFPFGAIDVHSQKVSNSCVKSKFASRAKLNPNLLPSSLILKNL